MTDPVDRNDPHFDDIKEKLPTLYGYDSGKRARLWAVEVEEDRYRFTTGLVDGSLVTSAWTVAEPKNVGRSNETSGERQAFLEAKAHWTKKMETGYGLTLESSATKYFDPMLAKSYEQDRVTGDIFYAQPKLDGIRCIARADGLWSRKGKPFPAVPHIWEQLKPLFDAKPDLVLDGELYSHSLRKDFNKITSHVKKQKPKPEDIEAAKVVEYHVYDAYYDDMPAWDFSTRYMHNARTLLRDAGESIVLVETQMISNGDFEILDDHFARWLQEEYEGQIVRINSPYEIGKRTFALLKRKEIQDADFKISSINPGVGNWAAAAKSIECFLPDGRTFSAGVKGSREEMIDIYNRRAEYPSGVATAHVRFLNYTPDGIPRGGVVYAFYPGERDD